MPLQLIRRIWPRHSPLPISVQLDRVASRDMLRLLRLGPFPDSGRIAVAILLQARSRDSAKVQEPAQTGVPLQKRLERRICSYRPELHPRPAFPPKIRSKDHEQTSIISHIPRPA
jgi:hypothetical protein